MSDGSLLKAKAYARQIISDGKIRNYDLYYSACIELEKSAGDPEVFDLLKKLRLLSGHDYNQTEVFHKNSTAGAWLIILFGIIILALGIVMYFVVNIHLVWIGGLILAITTIIFGAKLLKNNSIQNQRLKEINKPENMAKNLENNPDYMTINCGNCFTRYHIKKGQGVITSKCPNCDRQAKVIT